MGLSFDSANRIRVSERVSGISFCTKVCKTQLYGWCNGLDNPFTAYLCVVGLIPT